MKIRFFLSVENRTANEGNKPNESTFSSKGKNINRYIFIYLYYLPQYLYVCIQVDLYNKLHTCVVINIHIVELVKIQQGSEYVS